MAARKAVPRAVKRAWAPDRRDMIWINCNPQAGREMKDFHPLLVLSPRAFNEKSGIVIGLPMTTAAYNDGNPFAVAVEGPGGDKNGGRSYILAHQPKSFDWKARSARPHPMRRVPEAAMDAALDTLRQVIGLDG